MDADETSSDSSLDEESEDEDNASEFSVRDDHSQVHGEASERSAVNDDEIVSENSEIVSGSDMEDNTGGTDQQGGYSEHLEQGRVDISDTHSLREDRRSVVTESKSHSEHASDIGESKTTSNVAPGIVKESGVDSNNVLDIVDEDAAHGNNAPETIDERGLVFDNVSLSSEKNEDVGIDLAATAVNSHPQSPILDTHGDMNMSDDGGAQETEVPRLPSKVSTPTLNSGGSKTGLDSVERMVQSIMKSVERQGGGGQGSQGAASANTTPREDLGARISKSDETQEANAPKIESAATDHEQNRNINETNVDAGKSFQTRKSQENKETAQAVGEQEEKVSFSRRVGRFFKSLVCC